jgi:hypothetical protein
MIVKKYITRCEREGKTNRGYDSTRGEIQGGLSRLRKMKLISDLAQISCHLNYANLLLINHCFIKGLWVLVHEEGRYLNNFPPKPPKTKHPECTAQSHPR